MFKVFVSQPMRNKTEAEILEEKEKCIAYFRNLIVKLNGIFNESLEFEVINSYIEEQPSADVTNNGLWYLGKSLQLLSMADIVIFAKGWRKARGCRIERKCAETYGVTIIDYAG